jgi:uncharacterized OsmC-like protein
LTVINGVDAENLRALVDQVGSDSEEGHYTFRAVTTWDSGAHSTTRIRGFSLESDEPSSLLGNDRAPNAVEIVLGALGGCLSVGVAYVAALRAIRIRSLRFEIEGRLDIRGFLGIEGPRPGYEQIRVAVFLDSDAKRADLQALLDHVVRTSPVTDIIAHGVAVEIVLAE